MMTPEQRIEHLQRENVQLRLYAAQKASDAMLSEMSARDLARSVQRLVQEPFSKACVRDAQLQVRRTEERHAVGTKSGRELLAVVDKLLDMLGAGIDPVDFWRIAHDHLRELHRILRPNPSQLPALQRQPSTLAPGDEQARQPKNE